MMREERPAGFSDEVIDVFYSKDGTSRFVLLKRNDGLYSYALEKIDFFDEEDLRYLRGVTFLPGVWRPCGEAGASIFETAKEALRGLQSEPEYTGRFI